MAFSLLSAVPEPSLVEVLVRRSLCGALGASWIPAKVWELQSMFSYPGTSQAEPRDRKCNSPDVLMPKDVKSGGGREAPFQLACSRSAKLGFSVRTVRAALGMQLSDEVKPLASLPVATAATLEP